MILKWKVSQRDYDLINEISHRALGIMRTAGESKVTLADIQMDITAVHANGCPLQLAELLGADLFNFSHDLFGIRHYLDRNTGQLSECFSPRFAVRCVEVSA